MDSTYRHATPRGNVESIRRRGLLVSKATGRRRCVWLHTPSNTAWAIEHVAARHGVDVAEVVVLRVNVRRADLVRSHKRGLRYSMVDLRPEVLGAEVVESRTN